MWGAKDSKGDDDEEKDSNMMFKPVRPRRERLEEDAADEKESSGAGEDAMGETRGRRRRVDEEDNKEEEAPVGWMTSPNKKNARNKLKIEEDEAEPMSATKNNKHFDNDQFDDGIMLIPDLDEDGGDVEVDDRVAQAPRHVPRKIPTLAELEESMKSTVPVHDGTYDLGVLTRTLVPLESVQETNEAWDFESLLREVTDELTNTPKTVVSATISTSAVEKGNESAKNKKNKSKASKK